MNMYKLAVTLSKLDTHHSNQVMDDRLELVNAI